MAEEKEVEVVNYWVGSQYSEPSTALGFVMRHVVDNPGISHEDLRQAVLDGYVRRTGAKVDKAYVQSLITYAKRNNRLVMSEDDSPGAYPEKPVSEKPEKKEPSLTENARSVLVSLPGNVEEVSGAIQKTPSITKRTLKSLEKKGLVAESEDGYIRTPDGDQALSKAA